MSQICIDAETGIKCRCNDCGKEFASADDLDMVTDAEERISAGCIVPAGECPACGALAYYCDEAAPDWTAQRRLYNARKVVPTRPLFTETLAGWGKAALVEYDKASGGGLTEYGLIPMLIASLGHLADQFEGRRPGGSAVLLKEAIALYRKEAKEAREDMKGKPLVEEGRADG